VNEKDGNNNVSGVVDNVRAGRNSMKHYQILSALVPMMSRWYLVQQTVHPCQPVPAAAEGVNEYNGIDQLYIKKICSYGKRL
jgi:hypothetical protein